MALEANEQVTRNWVHEPERVFAARAEKIQRVLRIAEAPAALGGLALLFLGHRVAGANRKAIGALGSTLLMSAAGRFAYRMSATRLKALLPSFPPSIATT